jgi:hypothetical protein
MPLCNDASLGPLAVCGGTPSSSQPSPATSPLPGSWSGVVWRVPKQAEPFSGWQSASARRMERGQYQIDGLKGPAALPLFAKLDKPEAAT